MGWFIAAGILILIGIVFVLLFKGGADGTDGSIGAALAVWIGWSLAGIGAVLAVIGAFWS